MRKFFYIMGIIVFLVGIVSIFLGNKHKFVRTASIEKIAIVDDGKTFYLYDVEIDTVGELLEKYDGGVEKEDRVFPSRETKVFAGDSVMVNRKKKLTIKADGEEKVFETFGDSISTLLSRNGVELNENDIVVPNPDTLINDDVSAEITRVVFKEEIKTKKISFKSITEDDNEENFLKKYTKQTGKNGSKELIYKVAYHDGEEVDRELVEENITKEPVDEIIVQGTKVKLGKKHTGLCSWYAWTGTMAAANPWLPKGSYVKVTNKANGKSVIVKINDRGPFVPGRIIDLDKVAFSEIASIGAGVIDVVMEEVVQ